MRFMILMSFGVLAGCVQETGVPDGGLAFAQDCAGCHGADGKGGIGPNLTTLAQNNGGVFPREAVMATIDGLNRPPHFATAMPEFGAGDLGEAVIVETPDGLGTPTPVRLIALADYLERIQAP